MLLLGIGLHCQPISHALECISHYCSLSVNTTMTLPLSDTCTGRPKAEQGVCFYILLACGSCPCRGSRTSVAGLTFAIREWREKLVRHDIT